MISIKEFRYLELYLLPSEYLENSNIQITHFSEFVDKLIIRGYFRICNLQTRCSISTNTYLKLMVVKTNQQNSYYDLMM